MLIPEITLIAALVAVFVSLANSLFIWWGRQDLQQRIDRERQEQRALNSAAFGLARHLRKVQDELDQVKAGKSLKIKSVDIAVDENLDTLKLSESLGVSQSEAEVIAYLRPKKRRAS